MDDATFWAIVDRTVVYEADTERQADALASELNALSADDTVAFTDAFQRQLKRAYRWDLWAVNYIAHGGASDDGFEYFRRWLISKGQAAFEHLLKSPDDLADMVAGGNSGPLEYEEFATVSWDVWGAKTGREPNEIPASLDFMTEGAEPEGEPFSEDEAALAARFPKTWARWGDNPIS
ncbi:DUF4240 domain-containing protein [soil metagenome]